MTVAAEIVALSFGGGTVVLVVVGGAVMLVRHSWQRRRTFAEIRAHANEIHHRHLG